MIRTFPLFYYGFEITEDNQTIDFIEGSGSARIAYVDIGSYTPTSFCSAVKQALSTAGTLAYTVTFNRSSRMITISSAGGTFKLLTHTGLHLGTDPFSLMGFAYSADTSFSSSLTGTSPAGDFYAPQIWLQDFIPSENLQGAIDASVTRTAGGQVEVVKFGTEKFMECTITLASNIVGPVGSSHRPRATGYDDLLRFMKFLTTKAPIEFMADEKDPGTFETMLLESTTESSTGVKYRIKELWDKGLPDYYDSGKLVFRVIED